MDISHYYTASENESFILDTAKELRTAVEKEGKCGESNDGNPLDSFKKHLKSLQNMHWPT